MSRSPDFLVDNHGSIFLLRPPNEQAVAWVDENISQDIGYQHYWSTVVIEHRHTSNIVQSVVADGSAVSW